MLIKTMPASLKYIFCVFQRLYWVLAVPPVGADKFKFFSASVSSREVECLSVKALQSLCSTSEGPDSLQCQFTDMQSETKMTHFCKLKKEKRSFRHYSSQHLRLKCTSALQTEPETPTCPSQKSAISDLKLCSCWLQLSECEPNK